MFSLLQSVAVTDSLGSSPIMAVAEDLKSGNVDWVDVLQQLMHWALGAGRHILVAVVVYFVGRYVVKFLNYLLNQMLDRRKVEPTVSTFLKSFVNILLQVLLIVTVVSALGVNTTSFAALLASFGVAIGMALSGNLQNFAGGIIILFLKPYKVGDWIEAQGVSGSVQAIQIFHTILMTVDGRQIYVPNGLMSSGSITNFTHTPTRMTEWTIGIEYGEDTGRARQVVLDLLAADERILKEPAPVVWVKELGSSSVDLMIRAWTVNDDYWQVMFEVRERIYASFNAEDISFPFMQVTVHQAD
ncbi:MAG: mechanosensitive ion channel [Bacteroidaceae bacterium]|nr:mechanosensitive ion channel [Bacteroidaceae bacterium]